MPKRTVILHSRYDASEKTLCAIHFANYLEAQWWYRVWWICPGMHNPNGRYKGFSHKWDDRLLSMDMHQSEIAHIAEKCHFCFFFDESERLLSQLNKKGKKAMILDPYSWRETTRSFAKRCDYRLSTSPEITSQTAKRNVLTDVLSFPFDPATRMIPQTPLLSGETARIIYPAYGLTASEKYCVRRVADMVKECCPGTKNVVCSYDAMEEAMPGWDTRSYDWKLIEYLKQADWIVDLNPRPLFGLFTAFAGAISIQRTCFDKGANIDKYSAARRHLIDYPANGLSAVGIEQIVTDVVRHLMQPIHDDTDLHKNVSSYMDRLHVFHAAMDHMLKPKKKKNRSSRKSEPSML